MNARVLVISALFFGCAARDNSTGTGGTPQNPGTTGTTTTAAAGAYPPAGSPQEIAPASDAEYAHDAAGGDPHTDELGIVLHFAGVAVTNLTPTGFVKTKSDLSGSTPAGFEVTGGIWVDD